ncbi:LytR family transcriptional regulator [Prauserella sp. PE36]|uniref:LCP family protein n=1 Tax=Prauserella sp. PE36 TaxID=1504709 RepID=UPI000DE34B03|nr:LCP family protein [Prauserella sp. PE36]RBM18479.1 LytR family transcriptional regulator [Prauserella sp. PE36]
MTGWRRGPVEAPTVARRGRVGTFALRGGKVVISLLSVTVLALTWYVWQFIGNVNDGVTTTDVFDGDENLRAEPLDGAIDILLVGQDSRTDAQGNPLPQEVLDRLHAGEANGERQTDTMILVHIPQDGTRASAISFPRDSWVELAGGYGTHKLNSAFVYAYNDTFQTLQEQGRTDLEQIDEEAKVAGRRNLIATIEQLLGKPGLIDRYAEVNLASFYEVTRALGGVEVCLREAVRERNSGINLPAGRQTIQGVQALAFVRQRYELPNGDLDRIARQQAFLSGLVRKMLSTDVLFDPGKIGEVVGAVQKSVVLSEDWDLLQFAAQMRNLSGDNVEFRTIPVVGNTWIGGASVLEIDVQEVRRFVDGLISHETETETETPSDGSAAPATIPGAEAYTVEIYNASGADELGQQMREQLRQHGFLGESSATMDPQAHTVVRYAPGDEAGVELLRQALGTELAAEPDATVPAGQLQVLFGTDFEPATTGTTPANHAGQEPQFFAPPHRTQTPQDEGKDDPPDEPITAGDVPCVN